jgi:putative ABC transport system substrate-binding protein
VGGQAGARVDRREFLGTLAGGLLAAPLAAEAQPAANVRRVGVLLFSTPATDPNLPVFREALRRLGWIEGVNLVLQYRSAEGRIERLSQYAAELVQLKSDLIYALGGDVAPFAKRATSVVPIVIVVSNDPVRAGLVASLARPGGNVTGLTFLLSDLAAKRLEMLHEIAPKAARVGILWNPDHADPDFRETQTAAPRLGVDIVSLEVRRPNDLEAAFKTALRDHLNALIVVSSRLMMLQRQAILEFAATNRLPLVTGWGAWADGGALLTYGPDIDDIVRRSAFHVDRILRGARPSDLPLEQPTRFELVISLRAARALGLTIPPSLLQRADQVIE